MPSNQRNRITTILSYEVLISFMTNLLISFLSINSQPTTQDFLPFRFKFIYMKNGTMEKIEASDEINQIIKINKGAILDLIMTSLVTSVKFVIEDYSGDVKLTAYYINGEESLECPLIPLGYAIEFSCDHLARYIHLKSNSPIILRNISMSAKYLYSELFIGCFEFIEKPGQTVNNAYKCMEHCNSEKKKYSAVVNYTCNCFIDPLDLAEIEFDKCKTESCDSQFCGLSQNAPVYLSDYNLLVSRANNDVADVSCIIKGESNCFECKTGFTGIFCTLRDCNSSNGACGNHFCRTYHEIKIRKAVCLCGHGFIFDLDGCQDFDECTVELNKCDPKVCENTVGSFVCNCPTGFVDDKKGGCDDVDECLDSTLNTCNLDGTTCKNAVGNYTCECKTGFSSVSFSECKDIDECLNSSLNACEPVSTTCENTIGNYTCGCGTGFSRNSFDECIDINECLNSSPNNCDFENATCKNTIGNYTCVCNAGFTLLFRECKDIDECLDSSLDTCDINSTTCRNEIGNYTCMCNEGFLRKSFTECYDIDECFDSSLDTCDINSTTCRNGIGNYTCMCNEGFLRKSFTECYDIDECYATNYCVNRTTICVNKVGSFTCECRNGFQRRDSKMCEDTNECIDSNLCPKRAECINTVGSFDCKCPIGSRHIGDRCIDVDECTFSSQCDQTTSYCVNMAGKYRCECRLGYESLDEYSCQDIDECLYDRHNCHEKSMCTNTLGSYMCKCYKGYISVKYDYATNCEDIDECKLDDSCKNISMCINTHGSFYCYCNKGVPESEGCVGRHLTTNTASTSLLDIYLNPLEDDTKYSYVNDFKLILYAVFFVIIFLGTCAIIIAKLQSIIVPDARLRERLRERSIEHE